MQFITKWLDRGRYIAHLERQIDFLAQLRAEQAATLQRRTAAYETLAAELERANDRYTRIRDANASLREALALYRTEARG